jgi:hypothetical protein
MFWRFSLRKTKNHTCEGDRDPVRERKPAESRVLPCGKINETAEAGSRKMVKQALLRLATGQVGFT